jgi:pimeloyl-ACP methyl ester carboxylesterase
MGASANVRRRGPLAVAAAVLVCSVLVACGGERVVDLSGSTVVSFEAADGVRLEGRVFGNGTDAVVLSHMRPADQRSWFAFADRLADDGYLVLAYDFRGYCPGGDGGCSDGERDIAQIWKDVLGAMGYLRAEHGVGSISLVGASMGGTASLIAAAQPGANVGAVITLSAPTSFEGLVADPSLLSAIDARKLFIAGVGDASAAASAQTLYDEAPPPKRVEIVPANDHGTDLLTGARGEEVARMIETFLATG